MFFFLVLTVLYILLCLIPWCFGLVMKDKHSFLLSLLSPSFLFSVRPSTMTEEYRVPDGMVGLSEYTHRIAWAHTEKLFTHTMIK